MDFGSKNCVRVSALWFNIPLATTNGTTENRARGYKTFFMLNSVEHEILNAHKYKNIKKFSFFSGSDKRSRLFFLLINVKMPTIFDILTFKSRKNFMPS